MKKYFLATFCLLSLVFYIATAGFSESEEVKKSISPGEIRFVAVRVADVDKSREFYKSKLGFAGEAMGEFQVYEVAPGQYFALIPDDQGGEARETPAIIGFEVNQIDDYFKQVLDAGIKPIDHLAEEADLDRPVYRQWGTREFAIKTPDGDTLVFARMP